MCNTAVAQLSVDRLYGVQSIPLGPALSSLPHLVVIDPVSGAVEVVGRIRSNKLPYFPFGLVYSNSRLHLVSRWPVELDAIHPANGDPQTIGSIGVSSNGSDYLSLDLNPATGGAYLLHADGALPSGTSRLYGLDMSSGQVTLVGPITPNVYLFHFWFDVNGDAYALNCFNHLFRFDVTNASVTLIGALPFPDFVWDVAVDAQGRTLLAVRGGHPAFPETTLYELDTATKAVTKLSVVEGNIFGLSFVPDLRGTTYCSGKTNSAGCVPTIHSDGFPSEPARSGFDVWATNVVNRQRGTLLFGVNGPASSPFMGGTLCVMPSFSMTPAIDSGGSPRPVHDCSGAWFLDFNEFNYVAPGTAPLPAHVPLGTTVHCQWLGRDRGLATPNSASLSDALQFVVQP
jgi:hypothetical protein